MITIAMVRKPQDSNHHMWSINPQVFRIAYEANKKWPGVLAYRLTGQEKYYEPTWTEDISGAIQSTNDIELSLREESTKVRSHVVGNAPSFEPTERKPLTFIDLKTKV